MMNVSSCGLYIKGSFLRNILNRKQFEVNEKESTLVIIFENVSCIVTELPPEKILGRSPDYARINQVVLVDDVPMNLKVLGAMLKKLGAEVATAASGAEVLDMLEKGIPDVLLTDMWMPEMNGAELASRVRAIPAASGITIIAVTADTESHSNFDMSGIDGILMKPVSLDKLKKLLGTLRTEFAARQASGRPADGAPYNFG